MFSVNTENMAITMHKGDTGAFAVRFSLKGGSEFVDGDVAIFEAYQGTTCVMHREFNLQPDEATYKELGDGIIVMTFRNSDTDQMAAGSYNTEIRVALNPVRTDGKVVDGDTVRTILRSTLTITDVLINI